MAVKSWKRSQVLGTRAHLIETATRLFGEKGYSKTPLERVVAAAGLTRGAVYHHFKDKRALFEAVADKMLLRVVEEVERRTLERALERGHVRESDAIALFVDELGAATRHRILTVDGPSVLGRERWSELMWARLLDPIRRVVDKGVGSGAITGGLASAATHLLFGAVQEAALILGEGREAVAGATSREDPVTAEQMESGIVWLLERILGSES